MYPNYDDENVQSTLTHSSLTIPGLMQPAVMLSEQVPLICRLNNQLTHPPLQPRAETTTSTTRYMTLLSGQLLSPAEGGRGGGGWDRINWGEESSSNWSDGIGIDMFTPERPCSGFFNWLRGGERASRASPISRCSSAVALDIDIDMDMGEGGCGSDIGTGIDIGMDTGSEAPPPG